MYASLWSLSKAVIEITCAYIILCSFRSESICGEFTGGPLEKLEHLAMAVLKLLKLKPTIKIFLHKWKNKRL